MSERRAARVAQSVAGRVRYLGNELPSELAGGPCIEDWAKGPVPNYHAHHVGEWRDFRALRTWNAAVDEWAVSTGWAYKDRPARNARNLARTRYPWSRVFLAETDPAYLAWLEGETQTFPGRAQSGWNPSY